KTSCPDPGVSVDGARKGSCCLVGDVVTYSCKKGFELVGTDTLACLTTGNWSSPRPLCRHYSRCGLRPNHGRRTDGENTITGGDAAEAWPWMAAVYFTPRTGFPVMHCSGSIIHDLYILTNADCVDYIFKERKKDTPITVHLGLTDIESRLYEEVIDVKKLYIHEKHRNDGNYDYDIALLKLGRSIVYNDFVRPICLPPTNLSPETTLYKPNETAIVTGWGTDVREDEGIYVALGMRRYVKEVNLNLQSKENCVDFLKKKIRNMKFTERMLCTRGDGEDACVGHSGTPLVQPRFDSDGDIYWTQVGIASWSFWPCGREDGEDICVRDRGSPLMQPQLDSDGNIYWTQVGITAEAFKPCGGEVSYTFYTYVQAVVQWITERIEETINE
ncbi:serine protease 46-like, partial [Stegodyphus dumicola]|uniref:serine protease 46-like n=1 Tax=Stegodyphus dumicola TaxID=202533 RepID=UPI0015ADA617